MMNAPPCKFVAHSVFSSGFRGVDRWRLMKNGDSRGQNLKHLISKRALSKAPHQKPWATITNLRSTILLVALNVLLFMGCSVGSIATP